MLMIVAVQPLDDFVDVDSQRFGLRKSDDIIATADMVVSPDRRLRENGKERCKFALHHLRTALVERYPLGDHPPRIQTPPTQLEVLFRIQRGRPLHPRVNGIGGDDVEGFVRRQDIVPGIVVHDADARVVDDVMVLVVEVRRDDAGNQALDLADDDPLDLGMHDKRSGGHSRPASDHEHRTGFGMQERGEVRQHSLQPHILRTARRLDLAADVKVPRTVERHRDRDR